MVGEECRDVEVCDVFGLIKCKVLPSKIGGKLMFVLDRLCAVGKCKVCDHDDNEMFD